ncbi:MFS transporter [Aeromicrobium sp. YIM 150415]|uniref:MFS transporter n=1 Tax=Aeromicrobium sp. YIM 150415 TaxID=2803912 RepID=UPI001964C89E|nr:MFS transporter [Aeromicrobium sp. YIM 150415]MBM9464075.1 MFS transporter [Aeromicrobium sp. YIM 150415]
MNDPVRRHRLTLVVLCGAVGTFTMQQSLVVPVLPQIQEHFDSDQSSTTWLLTGYLLAASIVAPLLGRLGDSIGKQRTLIAALSVLTFGGAVASLAPDIGWLIVARLLQGAGGALLPISFGILRDTSPPTRLTRSIGLISSLTAVGFALGLVIGGPIVSLVGIRGLFWLPMTVTLAILVGACIVVPSSPPTTLALPSLAPAILLTGWLVALLLVVSRGAGWGWSSPVVIGLAGSTPFLFAAWIIAERRSRIPLIDLGMMRARGVWTSNLVVFLSGFGMFGAFGFLPQLLQTPRAAGYGLGASIAETGIFMLPWALTSFLGGIFAHRILERLPVRGVACVAMLLGSAAFIGMGTAHDQPWMIYLWTAIQGAGSGIVLACLTVTVVASVPPWQAGVANGMVSNIRSIGGAIGTAAMTALVTAHHTSSGHPVETGYTLGFTMLGIAYLVAASVALIMPGIADAEVAAVNKKPTPAVV